MKRQLLILTLLAFSLTLFMACGGGSKKMVKSETMEAYEDPFQDLMDMTNGIIDAGGVAAVGQGISRGNGASHR